MKVNLEKIKQRVILTQGYYSVTITLYEKLRQDANVIHKSQLEDVNKHFVYSIMNIIAGRHYIQYYRLQPEVYEVRTTKTLDRTITDTNIHYHCLFKIDKDYKQQFLNKIKTIQIRLGRQTKAKVLYKYKDLLNVMTYMNKAIKYEPYLKAYEKKHEKQIISEMYGRYTTQNKYIKKKCRISKDITNWFTNTQ